ALVAHPCRAERFAATPFGLERDPPALRDALRSQSDPTSILLRYRPDQLLVKVGERSLLCEVKSEAEGYPNFAVEADAYLAGLDWNAIYRHVAYAFCDLRVGVSWACWAEEIPSPQEIIVPLRHRHAADALRRMPLAFPDARIESRDYGNGSGTPFFLMPKPRIGSVSVLRPLALFARQDVWG